MNLQGEPLRVGRLVHAEQRDVSARAIQFYCDTFEDRHPAYASNAVGGPISPPLLFHSEVYRQVPRWYLKNLVGNLHARQEWQLFAPLRPGERIQTRSTIVERYRKRGRDYVVNEVDCVGPEGQLRVRGRTHQSFLAQVPTAGAGFVVDRGSAARKPRRALGEGAGPELEPVELLVDREVCWRFSGPSVNYHTDPDEARKLGFPAIVVQGMLSTCVLSQVMAQEFGHGWFAGGRMDVKLTNVLWAEERVRGRAKLREEQPEGQSTRRVFEIWLEKLDPDRTPVALGTASALVDA